MSKLKKNTETQEPLEWVGCRECDVIFPCYHGRDKCIRLSSELRKSQLQFTSCDNQEALQMADDLDRLCDPYDSAIATELRRLHSLNAELVKALYKCNEAFTWELGGEPIPSLMQEAQRSIQEVLNKLNKKGN